MGTKENEAYVRKAMQANVNVIQSKNIPRVMGDADYALLVEECTNGLRGDEAEREYERARQAAMHPFAAEKSRPARATYPRVVEPSSLPQTPQRQVTPAAPPHLDGGQDTQRPAAGQTTLTLAPENSPIPIGARVLVPRSLWPNTYTCNEWGGAGWEGKVISKTASTAMGSFTHARTRDGRLYQPERLPLSHLRRFELHD